MPPGIALRWSREAPRGASEEEKLAYEAGSNQRARWRLTRHADRQTDRSTDRQTEREERHVQATG
jgi:hypothetical protein